MPLALTHTTPHAWPDSRRVGRNCNLETTLLRDQLSFVAACQNNSLTIISHEFTYYSSKDCAEFLGPKHSETLSVLPKHFLFLSVGPVHPYRRETISRLHTEKLSRNRRLQENMESPKSFFVRPQYCPPLFPPQSSVKLPKPGTAE